MIMKSQNKITTHLLDLSPVLSRLLSHIYYVENLLLLGDHEVSDDVDARGGAQRRCRAGFKPYGLRHSFCDCSSLQPPLPLDNALLTNKQTYSHSSQSLEECQRRRYYEKGIHILFRVPVFERCNRSLVQELLPSKVIICARCELETKYQNRRFLGTKVERRLINYCEQ
jgi:hypothetical protein